MTKPPLSNENAYNLDIINRHKNIFVLLDGTILTDTKSLRDFSRVLGVLPTTAFTGKLRPKGVPSSGFRYMKGWGFSVANPGEGPGGPKPHSLFLDQTDARSAEKKFGETSPPSPVAVRKYAKTYRANSISTTTRTPFNL